MRGPSPPVDEDPLRPPPHAPAEDDVDLDAESLYEQRRRILGIIERKRIDHDAHLESGHVAPPSTRMKTKGIVDRVEVMRQALIVREAELARGDPTFEKTVSTLSHTRAATAGRATRPESAAATTTTAAAAEAAAEAAGNLKYAISKAEEMQKSYKLGTHLHDPWEKEQKDAQREAKLWARSREILAQSALLQDKDAMQEAEERGEEIARFTYGRWYLEKLAREKKKSDAVWEHDVTVKEDLHVRMEKIRDHSLTAGNTAARAKREAMAHADEAIELNDLAHSKTTQSLGFVARAKITRKWQAAQKLEKEASDIAIAMSDSAISVKRHVQLYGFTPRDQLPHVNGEVEEAWQPPALEADEGEGVAAGGALLLPEEIAAMKKARVEERERIIRETSVDDKVGVATVGSTVAPPGVPGEADGSSELFPIVGSRSAFRPSGLGKRFGVLDLYDVDIAAQMRSYDQELYKDLAGALGFESDEGGAGSDDGAADAKEDGGAAVAAAKPKHSSALDISGVDVNADDAFKRLAASGRFAVLKQRRDAVEERRAREDARRRVEWAREAVERKKASEALKRLNLSALGGHVAKDVEDGEEERALEMAEADPALGIAATHFDGAVNTTMQQPMDRVKLSDAATAEINSALRSGSAARGGPLIDVVRSMRGDIKRERHVEERLVKLVVQREQILTALRVTAAEADHRFRDNTNTHVHLEDVSAIVDLMRELQRTTVEVVEDIERWRARARRTQARTEAVFLKAKASNRLASSGIAEIVDAPPSPPEEKKGAGEEDDAVSEAGSLAATKSPSKRRTSQKKTPRKKKSKRREVAKPAGRMWAVRFATRGEKISDSVKAFKHTKAQRFRREAIPEMRELRWVYLGLYPSQDAAEMRYKNLLAKEAVRCNTTVEHMPKFRSILRSCGKHAVVETDVKSIKIEKGGPFAGVAPDILKMAESTPCEQCEVEKAAGSMVWKPAYVWNGFNYLKKLMDDVEFLAESTVVQQWFQPVGLKFVKNPMLLVQPDDIAEDADDDELDRWHSIEPLSIDQRETLRAIAEERQKRRRARKKKRMKAGVRFSKADAEEPESNYHPEMPITAPRVRTVLGSIAAEEKLLSLLSGDKDDDSDDESSSEEEEDDDDDEIEDELLDMEIGLEEKKVVFRDHVGNKMIVTQQHMAHATPDQFCPPTYGAWRSMQIRGEHSIHYTFEKKLADRARRLILKRERLTARFRRILKRVKKNPLSRKANALPKMILKGYKIRGSAVLLEVKRAEKFIAELKHKHYACLLFQTLLRKSIARTLAKGIKKRSKEQDATWLVEEEATIECAFTFATDWVRQGARAAATQLTNMKSQFVRMITLDAQPCTVAVLADPYWEYQGLKHKERLMVRATDQASGAQFKLSLEDHEALQRVAREILIERGVHDVHHRPARLQSLRDREQEIAHATPIDARALCDDGRFTSIRVKPEGGKYSDDELDSLILAAASGVQTTFDHLAIQANKPVRAPHPRWFELPPQPTCMARGPSTCVLVRPRTQNTWEIVRGTRAVQAAARQLTAFAEACTAQHEMCMKQLDSARQAYERAVMTAGSARDMHEHMQQRRLLTLVTEQAMVQAAHEALWFSKQALAMMSDLASASRQQVWEPLDDANAQIYLRMKRDATRAAGLTATEANIFASESWTELEELRWTRNWLTFARAEVERTASNAVQAHKIASAARRKAELAVAMKARTLTRLIYSFTLRTRAGLQCHRRIIFRRDAHDAHERIHQKAELHPHELVAKTGVHKLWWNWNTVLRRGLYVRTPSTWTFLPASQQNRTALLIVTVLAEPQSEEESIGSVMQRGPFAGAVAVCWSWSLSHRDVADGEHSQKDECCVISHDRVRKMLLCDRGRALDGTLPLLQLRQLWPNHPNGASRSHESKKKKSSIADQRLHHEEGRVLAANALVETMFLDPFDFAHGPVVRVGKVWFHRKRRVLLRSLRKSRWWSDVQRASSSGMGLLLSRESARIDGVRCHVSVYASEGDITVVAYQPSSAATTAICVPRGEVEAAVEEESSTTRSLGGGGGDKSLRDLWDLSVKTGRFSLRLIRVAVLSRLRWAKAHGHALPAMIDVPEPVPVPVPETTTGEEEDEATTPKRWCKSLQCPMGKQLFSEFTNAHGQVVPLCRRCLFQRTCRGKPVSKMVQRHQQNVARLREEMRVIEQRLRWTETKEVVLQPDAIDRLARRRAVIVELLAQIAQQMIMDHEVWLKDVHREQLVERKRLLQRSLVFCSSSEERAPVLALLPMKSKRKCSHQVRFVSGHQLETRISLGARGAAILEARPWDAANAASEKWLWRLSISRRQLRVIFAKETKLLHPRMRAALETRICAMVALRRAVASVDPTKTGLAATLTLVLSKQRSKKCVDFDHAEPMWDGQVEVRGSMARVMTAGGQKPTHDVDGHGPATVRMLSFAKRLNPRLVALEQQQPPIAPEVDVIVHSRAETVEEADVRVAQESTHHMFAEDVLQHRVEAYSLANELDIVRKRLFATRSMTLKRFLAEGRDRVARAATRDALRVAQLAKCAAALIPLLGLREGALCFSHSASAANWSVGVKAAPPTLAGFKMESVDATTLVGSRVLLRRVTALPCNGGAAKHYTVAVKDCEWRLFVEVSEQSTSKVVASAMIVAAMPGSVSGVTAQEDENDNAALLLLRSMGRALGELCLASILHRRREMVSSAAALARRLCVSPSQRSFTLIPLPRAWGTTAPAVAWRSDPCPSESAGPGSIAPSDLDPALSNVQVSGIFLASSESEAAVRADLTLTVAISGRVLVDIFLVGSKAKEEKGKKGKIGKAGPIRFETSISWLAREELSQSLGRALFAVGSDDGWLLGRLGRDLNAVSPRAPPSYDSEMIDALVAQCSASGLTRGGIATDRLVSELCGVLDSEHVLTTVLDWTVASVGGAETYAQIVASGDRRSLSPPLKQSGTTEGEGEFGRITTERAAAATAASCARIAARRAARFAVAMQAVADQAAATARAIEVAMAAADAAAHFFGQSLGVAVGPTADYAADSARAAAVAAETAARESAEGCVLRRVTALVIHSGVARKSERMFVTVADWEQHARRAIGPTRTWRRAKVFGGATLIYAVSEDVTSVSLENDRAKLFFNVADVRGSALWIATGEMARPTSQALLIADGHYLAQESIPLIAALALACKAAYLSPSHPVLQRFENAMLDAQRKMVRPGQASAASKVGTGVSGDSDLLDALRSPTAALAAAHLKPVATLGWREIGPKIRALESSKGTRVRRVVDTAFAEAVPWEEVEDTGCEGVGRRVLLNNALAIVIRVVHAASTMQRLLTVLRRSDRCTVEVLVPLSTSRLGTPLSFASFTGYSKGAMVSHSAGAVSATLRWLDVLDSIEIPFVETVQIVQSELALRRGAAEAKLVELLPEPAQKTAEAPASLELTSEPADEEEITEEEDIPAGWTKIYDEECECEFYVNIATGEQSWDCPEGIPTPPEAKLDSESSMAQAEKFRSIMRKAKMSPEMRKKFADAKKRQSAQSISPWVEVYDPSDEEFYYWHTFTGEVTWERPDDYKLAADDETMSAVIKIQSIYRAKHAKMHVASKVEEIKVEHDSWVAVWDTAVTPPCVYYWNRRTGVALWDAPEGVDVDLIPSMVGEEIRENRLHDILRKAKMPTGMRKKFDDAKKAESKLCTSPWVEVYDPETEAYYYWNRETQEQTWDVPDNFRVASDDATMAAVIKLQCLWRRKQAQKIVDAYLAGEKVFSTSTSLVASSGDGPDDGESLLPPLVSAILGRVCHHPDSDHSAPITIDRTLWTRALRMGPARQLVLVKARVATASELDTARLRSFGEEVPRELGVAPRAGIVLTLHEQHTCERAELCIGLDDLVHYGVLSVAERAEAERAEDGLDWTTLSATVLDRLTLLVQPSLETGYVGATPLGADLLTPQLWIGAPAMPTVINSTRRSQVAAQLRWRWQQRCADFAVLSRRLRLVAKLQSLRQLWRTADRLRQERERSRYIGPASGAHALVELEQRSRSWVGMQNEDARGHEHRPYLAASTKELELLRVRFDEFDADGSGTISAREFQDVAFESGGVVSTAEVRRTVARIDINGDGTIDFNEFALWWLTRDPTAKDNKQNFVAKGMLGAKLGVRSGVRKISKAVGIKRTPSMADVSSRARSASAGDDALDSAAALAETVQPEGEDRE